MVMDPRRDGGSFEEWGCSLILVIVIGSLAHDMSRLSLRTLYIYFAYVNVWKSFMPCKPLWTRIPIIVSRMKFLPNSGHGQGIDRRSVGYAKARHVRLSLWDKG